MNDRERWIAVMTFQPTDRVPFEPGHGRKSTHERWHREGLPENEHDTTGYVRRLLGMPPATGGPQTNVKVDFRMLPQFEERVLERRPAPAGSSAPGSLIVQDWKGNICEISDEFDVSYLRTAIDFVTRSWIKCPVESRDDWRDMVKRYDVNSADRWPVDFHERCAKLKERQYASGFVINGPFWQLREWLGFENLCMLFLDDPAFAQEMIDFWQDFICRMLAKILKEHVPDYVIISEDMAYKEKPMIGPEMSRQFLSRCWKTWSEQLRSAGVPVIEMDSDGFVSELIPVWIESGINSNSPLEVAAGNDLPMFRRTYGKRMAYRGGVDKRAIAAGGLVIKKEIDRLRPAIEVGGYIPGCDHGVPHDVSWPNFVEYCRLLAHATGWI